MSHTTISHSVNNFSFETGTVWYWNFATHLLLFLYFSHNFFTDIYFEIDFLLRHLLRKLQVQELPQVFPILFRNKNHHEKQNQQKTCDTGTLIFFQPCEDSSRKPLPDTFENVLFYCKLLMIAWVFTQTPFWTASLGFVINLPQFRILFLTYRIIPSFFQKLPFPSYLIIFSSAWCISFLK